MVFNYSKYKGLLKERLITTKLLELGTSIPSNTIYSYLSGRSQPSPANLRQLAEIVDLEPKDLLTGDLQKTVKQETLLERLEKENDFLKKEVDNWKTHADFLKRVIEEKLNLGKLQANRSTAKEQTKVIPLSISNEAKLSA